MWFTVYSETVNTLI